MKTKANDPVDWSQHIKSQHSMDGTFYEGMFPGLTKREYFAAMAMQGYISGVTGVEALCGVHPMNYASDAVQCADALIESLNKYVTANAPTEGES